MDERDEVLTALHHVDFMHAVLFVEQRLLDLQNEVCTVVDIANVFNDFRARFRICSVHKERACACALLNEHGVSVCDELFDGFRSCCDTIFIVHNLFGDTDNHDLTSPLD